MTRPSELRLRARKTLGSYYLWNASVRYSRRDQEFPPTLGIGSRNSAGQAHAWARALSAHQGSFTAESFYVRRSTVLGFESDREFSTVDWNSLRWQVKHARYLFSHYTHLLVESGESVFGNLRNGFFDGDLPLLRKAGIGVAMVFHGSDIRNPDHHASIEELSPFRLTSQDELSDPTWSRMVADLREKTMDLKRRLDSYAATIPKFVSTPGLLDYIPDARWLPAVIDTAEQHRMATPSGSLPIVVHLPTNERMKGSRHIDAVCRRLELGGVVRYERPSLVTPAEAAGLLRQAYCVIDAISLGDGPSVTACQAMAGGVPVVGHISDSVRRRIPADLPIVEARPDTLESVIRRLVSNPDEVAELADAGRAYVQRFHSGPYAADVLSGWLGDGRFPQGCWMPQ